MSIPCWFIGVSLAYSKGYFDIQNAVLSLIGALVLHLCVNAFNELFDYLRGNDTEESLSEYSGGGGYLVKGIVSPFEMGTFAIILLTIGCSIGIYIAFEHKIILIIGLIGVTMILLYTPILKPIGLGEVAMIIGFSCISIGSYVSMFEPNKYYFDLNTFLLFLLPGIWKSTVLLVNEFPDYENDKRVNVKNWVVRFGRQNASYIYLLMMLIYYGITFWLYINQVLNIFSLLSFFTIPLFLNIFVRSLKYRDLRSHVPVMKNQVSLGFISLMIIGISMLIG